jgi:hypothetical protein
MSNYFAPAISSNVIALTELDGHMRQRFILVQGTVCAKPYSSGAAALVFVCSITGAIAPSYEVDGIGGRRWIPGPRSLPSSI